MLIYLVQIKGVKLIYLYTNQLRNNKCYQSFCPMLQIVEARIGIRKLGYCWFESTLLISYTIFLGRDFLKWSFHLTASGVQSLPFNHFFSFFLILSFTFVLFNEWLIFHCTITPRMYLIAIRNKDKHSLRKKKLSSILNYHK